MSSAYNRVIVLPAQDETPEKLLKFFVGLCSACDDPVWVNEFMARFPELDVNCAVEDNHDDLHLGLHAAAGNGHLAILSLLLSSPRIDPLALDLFGKTAMAVALDKQKSNAFFFLLHHPRIATDGVVHDHHVVSYLGERDLAKGIAGKPVQLREYLTFDARQNAWIRRIVDVMVANTKESLYLKLAK